MEFTIEKNELLAGLYLTQGIVERRTTVPILTNILIESVGEGVSVAATDQEVGVRRVCAASVKRKGKLCTGARKLYEMVREFPVGEVWIRAQENNWIEVSAGRSRFRLVGIDPREFPEVPTAPAEHGEQEIRVSTDTLTEMIEYTAFAISADETRANLNGLLLECVEPGRVRIVSTDGHRLAMVTRPVEAAQPGKGVIIPRKGVGELRKVLEDGDEPVDVAIAGGVAHAVRGRVQMWMRLVEGEFPDYNQVMPAKSERVAVIEAAALLAGLRRISVISSERTRGVRLQLEGKRLELSTINPDVGEGTEELEIEYHSEPVGIGFNARYLIDVLNVLPNDARVEISLCDEVSPGVIRAVGDSDYCYIVMPLRL